MKPSIIFSLLAVFNVVAALAADKDGFKPLFNGKDFTGWEQHGGIAKYRVEGGAVVGQTVANTDNSFLCTTKTYGDFILEFEFKVAENMNSGVQFRSLISAKEYVTHIKGKDKTFPADRVHGYQYEIDPSPRAYTGGVFDEARRGWLADLEDNKAAQKAFKNGKWNKVRIQCKGDRIRTWINGVKATDFKDSMTPKGIIALQVHGIGDGKKKAPGEEVSWRNIRIKEF